MKYILILLSLSITFLSAETIFNGKCVNSFYTLDSTTLKISYSNGSSSTVSESKAKIEELVSNVGSFYYDANNSYCVGILDDATIIFMDSLSGILIGFSILFGLILLTIRIGSK